MSDIFDKIQQKTNVSEQQLRSLANKVSHHDMRDEKMLRALIAQVSALAGVPVSKEKEDQIVNYLIKHNLNPNDMQSMIKMFMKPKK